MTLDNPVTRIGMAHGRYGDRPFGIRLRDRLMHFYVIGQTGTGKSTLLLNMARQDARRGIGFCLIDPHGDMAATLAQELSDTAIIWNLDDPSCPYGYNPLTRTSPELHPLIASGLIETLKKQWADAWGVRMEHLLRYAILALLTLPHTDMRDILRLYLDREFRRMVVGGLDDPQLLQFWTEEYPAMNYKNAADGLAPIANKLGAFLAHPVVRKAVCAPEQPLRMRRIMDDGGQLIVNLAKGRLGGDMANLLGGLIVSSLANAAFSRHGAAPEARRPFMAYIDEFHAITTDAIGDVLSESRKYALGLTLSHQHTKQTSPEVFASVMGNVGSLLSFRIGASDAPTIAAQLGDVAERDLLNLPNYRAWLRLMHDGTQSLQFTATTFPPPPHAS
jgi:hypothetical protein